jgi:division protein CdvB (Snf7/Vps24/ESCRT-III family)
MEMMSDSIDDALDDDEAEEETEELTNQVFSVLPHYQLQFLGRQSNLWTITHRYKYVPILCE